MPASRRDFAVRCSTRVVGHADRKVSRTSNRPSHGYGHLDGLQRYGELLRRGEHVTEGTLRADPHYSLDDGEGAAITADAVVLIDL
jgi:hypothetical protein